MGAASISGASRGFFVSAPEDQRLVIFRDVDQNCCLPCPFGETEPREGFGALSSRAVLITLSQSRAGPGSLLLAWM